MLVNRLERNKKQAASVLQLFMAPLGLFLHRLKCQSLSPKLLQLATIRHLAVITTSTVADKKSSRFFSVQRKPMERKRKRNGTKTFRNS